MATEWRMVRIPVELAEQLERLSAETNRAHAAGRLKLPTEYAVGVPLHVTIKMAADCLEAHRRRGRRPRKGGTTHRRRRETRSYRVYTINQ